MPVGVKVGKLLGFKETDRSTCKVLLAVLSRSRCERIGEVAIVLQIGASSTNIPETVIVAIAVVVVSAPAVVADRAVISSYQL